MIYNINVQKIIEYFGTDKEFFENERLLYWKSNWNN